MTDIVNGDFETNDLTGWTGYTNCDCDPYISDIYYNSGSYSVCLHATDTLTYPYNAITSITQSITIVGNETLSFAWRTSDVNSSCYCTAYLGDNLLWQSLEGTGEWRTEHIILSNLEFPPDAGTYDLIFTITARGAV
jgi:hypothetical protein